MDVGWELPLYSSDLEPHELKRLRCGVCVTAFADIQCHRCNQQFCHACEATAHSAVSDPEAHREVCEPCNVCQECQMSGPDIFCRDCEQYQCDLCCAAAHDTDDTMRTHILVCMEGASVASLRQQVWGVDIREAAKRARRRQQHAVAQIQAVVKQEAGALPDFLPLSPVHDDDETSDEDEFPHGADKDAAMEETTREEEAVQIKMERVHLRGPEGDDVTPVSGTHRHEVTGPPGEMLPEMEMLPEVPVKTESADTPAPRVTEEQQHSDMPSVLTSDEGTLPPIASDHARVETTREEEAVQIKMERVRLHHGPDNDDLASANGADRRDDAVPPATEELQAPLPSVSPPEPAPLVEIKTERVAPQPVAKRTWAKKIEVVDLTGDNDDNENDDGHTMRASPAPPTAPVKAEPSVSSAWAASSVALPSSLLDNDNISIGLIQVYHELSEQVFRAELDHAALWQRSRKRGASAEEIDACQRELAGLRIALVELSQRRTLAVAKLLHHLHGSEPSFPLQPGDTPLDDPAKQTEHHHQLRVIHVAIEQQRTALDAATNEMDEAVATSAGADVFIRVDAERSSYEQQLQTLEAHQLAAFRQLAIVSAAVRRTALALVVDQKPSRDDLS